jgi:hypothetical protein
MGRGGRICREGEMSTMGGKRFRGRERRETEGEDGNVVSMGIIGNWGLGQRSGVAHDD